MTTLISPLTERPSRKAPTAHHRRLEDQHLREHFAQTEALAFGKPSREVQAEGTPPRLEPHRTFEGNRPSNAIVVDRGTPAALGRRVTLCEHSVLTQGTIGSTHSFDQWSVGLGKVLAQRNVQEIEGKDEPKLRHDSSEDALIRRYRRRKKGRS